MRASRFLAAGVAAMWVSMSSVAISQTGAEPQPPTGVGTVPGQPPPGDVAAPPAPPGPSPSELAKPTQQSEAWAAEPIAPMVPPGPPTAAQPPMPVAAPEKSPDPKPVQLGTLLYLHGVTGSKGGESYNRFYLGRAYLSAQFKPVAWFGARVTMDAHQKKDDGDWSVRLKYAFGQLDLGNLGPVLSGANAEFGMVHTPWLDFEEHINRYRMQGTMFLERNGLFNSADLGLTVGANLGPKLGDNYTRTVNKSNAGRFGSFALGVYNGGGYASQEANENKVAEARLSVRPLGELFPNLQLSWFGVFGKGNTEAAPPWRLNAAMASFEHRYVILTGTYAAGRGNQKGDALDATSSARKFVGYSAFGELKLPWIDTGLFGRFDRFDWDRSGGQAPGQRVIVGAAYWFLHGNAVVVDWDWLNEKDASKPDEKAAKVTLQVALP